MTPDVLIAGAGIYGVAASLELRARGCEVGVLDPGPIPHPLAASTDISKVIRMEYGADEHYMEMVECALPGWRRWNAELGETLYHETGVTMFTRSPMRPGGFEYESYQALLRRGHHPERLEGEEISRRFPAWKPGSHVDGFYHALGGFAESGRVVSALVAEAARRGVRFLPGETVRQVEVAGGRAAGVRTASGDLRPAGSVLVAAGAWTSLLLPELAPVMRASGHPVFHLRPADPALFTPPRFVTFTADVSRTGWYGFPVHPREGVVKLANHGSGREIHPEASRVVTAAEEENLRAMLAGTFPQLASAPLVHTRRCLYCDTRDEHFWIDRHPEVDRLTVAAGGSGHAFKMAPLLGGLIADALEGKPNRWLPRFRWRSFREDASGQEAARFHPDAPAGE